MHLRRALLLFALVLGMTALAASLAPAPERSKTDDGAPAPPPPRVRESATTVSFRAQPRAARPPHRAVRPGQHVVVEVSARALGQAALPQLGLVDSVEPATPARFDVLVPGRGRYDVVFVPPGGGEQRIGTLVSGE